MCACVQGRQFVFKSAGDNNHKFECGLKSAGYNYVFISLTFITISTALQCID